MCVEMDFLFKINKRDSTFIREMRGNLHPFKLDMFGYNCLTGNCNIIKYSGSDYIKWEIIDGCFTWIPCAIMLPSYSAIWCYILANDRK